MAQTDPLSQGTLGQQVQQSFPAQPQQPAPQAQSTPPKPQQASPDQIQQGLNTAAQYYNQQLQANQQQPPSGGPVRNMLQRFFSGMGQSMMHEAGLPTPYEMQQRAVTGLQGVANAQGMLALHQQMAAQYAPVPLVGLDGKPIIDPTTGRVISLPANHAQTFYAGQAAAGSRVQVQGMKNVGAETVQSMRNTEQTQLHPVQQLMNDAAAAYQSGDMETYKNKLTELGQLQGSTTAAARQDRLDMFRQTQQYQTWKTNQDNQTKLNIAQITAGKAPAAMMQTASFAQSGLNRLDDAQAAMQRLEARGVLGNVASNKIENWIFGKGLVDPTLPAQDKEDIGKLRAAASYTSSAAMRAHTGRTSREIYDDFKNTMGINQGPDAWKGAMQETRSMLGDYANGATNMAIQKLRGIPSTTPGAQTPTAGTDPFAPFGGKRR